MDDDTAEAVSTWITGGCGGWASMHAAHGEASAAAEQGVLGVRAVEALGGTIGEGAAAAWSTGEKGKEVWMLESPRAKRVEYPVAIMVMVALRCGDVSKSYRTVVRCVEVVN